MTARRTRRLATPHVESLEGRVNPKVFHVTTYFDASPAAPTNPTDLVHVMTATNSNGEDDTVFIDADITYAAPTSPTPTHGGNVLTITGDSGHKITFQGDPNRPERYKIDGGGQSQLFIVSNATASFSDLALVHGYVDGNTFNPQNQAGGGQGGAVYLTFGSTVTLDHVTVADNAAVGGTSSFFSTAAAGGGIFVDNSATLTVTSSLFVANQAIGYTYFGLPAPPTPPPAGQAQNGTNGAGGAFGGSADGGAIFTRGAVTITDSVFTGNVVQGGDAQPGGNGGVPADGTATNVGYTGGAGGAGGDGGDAGGGAISVQFGTSLALYSTLIGPDNQAIGGKAADGGSGADGGTATGSTGGTGGAAGAGGQGGDALGGAVYSGQVFGAAGGGGTVVIGNGTISDNTATAGAAGAAGTPGAGGGGAMTGAAGAPAAAATTGLGVGGVYVGGQLTLASTTVANNHAGGVYVGTITGRESSVTPLNVFNGLLAANEGYDIRGRDNTTLNVTASGSLVQTPFLDGSSAPVTQTLLQPPTSPTGGPTGRPNVTGQDPHLLPLADNGALKVGSFAGTDYFLQTLAIPPSGDAGTPSPAFDIGDATYLTAALIGDTAHDGRGNSPRVVGTTVDAGSFETTVAATTTTGDLRVTAGAPTVVGSATTWTVTVTNAGPDRLTAVRITVALPAGLFRHVARSLANGATSADAEPSTGNFTNTADLPKDASVTYTYTADAASSVADGLLTVSADPGQGAVDPDASDNSVLLTLPAPLTVTITRAAGQAALTNALPIRFDVVFSAPVLPSALTPDLLQLTGVDLNRATVSVSPTSGATTTRFTVAVSGVSDPVTVTVGLPAQRVPRADFTDVTNDASTGADNSVTYIPVFGITAAGAPTVGAPFTVMVTAPAGFVGDATVTITNDFVAGETQPISFAAGDPTTKPVTFTPTTPGVTHVTVVSKANPNVLGFIDLTVAPFTTSSNPLSPPNLVDAPGGTQLASGRYYTNNGAAGDEPAVTEFGTPATISVLNVNPVHVSQYGLPERITGGATALGVNERASPNDLETASLTHYSTASTSGFSPNVDGTVANDFIATNFLNGQVAVLYDGPRRETDPCMYTEGGVYPAYNSQPFTIPGAIAATAARSTSLLFPDVIVADANDTNPGVALIRNRGDGSSEFGPVQFFDSQGNSVYNPNILTSYDPVHFVRDTDLDVPLPKTYPVAIVAAPLYGGEFDDLAVADALNNDIIILQHSGSTYTVTNTRLPLPPGYQPRRLVAADLDGDSKIDLAVAAVDPTTNAGIVAVFYGDGAGKFTPAQVYAALDGVSSIAVADVNGDGLPDLLTASPSEGSLGVLLHDYKLVTPPVGTNLPSSNEFARAFTAVQRHVVGAQIGDFGFFPNALLGLATGDYNDDDRPDVVVLGSLGGATSEFIFYSVDGKDGVRG